MKMFYTIETFGKKYRKYKTRQSRSFLQQFNRTYYTLYSGIEYNVVDIGGHSRTIPSSAIDQGCFQFDTLNGGSAQYCRNNGFREQSGYGLVVGSGTNAVTAIDRALQTKIAHGRTSGTLEYSSTSFTPVVAANPYATFTMSRLFRNSSGGNVSINELGLYGAWYFWNGSSADTTTVCFVRDKLASTITVTDGTYIIITYTFQITA